MTESCVGTGTVELELRKDVRFTGEHETRVGHRISPKVGLLTNFNE